jgi:hypothetical protein
MHRDLINPINEIKPIIVHELAHYFTALSLGEKAFITIERKDHYYVTWHTSSKAKSISDLENALIIGAAGFVANDVQNGNFGPIQSDYKQFVKFLTEKYMLEGNPLKILWKKNSEIKKYKARAKELIENAGNFEMLETQADELIAKMSQDERVTGHIFVQQEIYDEVKAMATFEPADSGEFITFCPIYKIKNR